MDDITRVCRKCGQEKLLSEFAKDKTRTLGHSYICKQCKYEQVRNWRAANPEKARKWCREYSRKKRENLADGYLINKLKRFNLPITPETIDYKRIQLKLYREIKNQQNDERD